MVNQVRQLSGDVRLSDLRSRANELHSFFYTRRVFLNGQDISEGLGRMALFLDILEPLTGSTPNL